MMDKNCENCRYYEHEDIDGGYVCTNDESDYLSDWVEPNHYCEDWSGNNEPEN